jgi:WD40 repeat protein
MPAHCRARWVAAEQLKSTLPWKDNGQTRSWSRSSNRTRAVSDGGPTLNSNTSSEASGSRSFATVALATGLLLTSLLLGLALFQSNGANRRLLAGKLLDEAEACSQSEPETAILLALESYRLEPGIRSLDVLRKLLDPLCPRPAIQVLFRSEEAVWRVHPGGRALTLLDHGQVKVMEVSTGRVVRWFDTGGPAIAALSPDGLTAATLGPSGVLSIWDAGSARKTGSWTASAHHATGLLLSNAARVLALLEGDAAVHLIRHPAGGEWTDEPLPPPAGHEDPLGHTEGFLAGDGSRLALWRYTLVGVHESRCTWDLYETRTGKVLDRRSYQEADCSAGGVVLSPSGSHLAAREDENVSIHSGRSVIAPTGGRRAGQVVFSPRETLVAIEEAAAIRVVRPGAAPRGEFREAALLRAGDDETLLSVSDALPGRNALVLTCDRNRVALRDLPSGETLLLVPFPAPVLQAEVTPDRRFLIASTDTALFVQRLDAADSRVWNHDGTAIRGLQVTPDGKRLLTIGDDDGFRAWDLRSGQLVAKSSLDESSSDDGDKLWSVQQSGDGSFILLQALNRFRDFRAFGGPAKHLFTSPAPLPALPGLDYRRVWLSGRGNGMLALDVGLGGVLSQPAELSRLTSGGMQTHYSFQASGRSIPRLSPDGNYVAANTQEGIEVVNTRTSKSSVLPYSGGEADEFAFSPAGPILAVVAEGGGYELWNHRTMRRIYVRPAAGAGGTDYSVAEAFFSARGTYLAVAAEPLSYIFEAATGRAVASLESADADACGSPDGDVYGVDFPRGPALQISPDERHVAGCDGGKLVVVNLPSGRKSPAPKPASGGFQLAPDYLAVASGHHITVVRTDTMVPVARINHPDTVSGLLFTPDYGQLVSWGGARIRRGRNWGNPAAEACQKVTRNLTSQEWRTHAGDIPYHKACPGLP